jgi:GGDEF domain-containing protein/PAS domain-containing protein
MTTAGIRAGRPLDLVVGAYVGLVFSAGMALLGWFALTAGRVDPLPLAIFCAAAALGELMRVRVTYESVAISLTLIVNLAAVVALGPLGATASGVAAAAAAGIWLRPRPPLRKTLFNVGLFALSTGAAALAYRATGGDIGGHGRGGYLLFAAASAAALVANFAVNWPLVIGVVHLTSGKSVRQIWDEALRWTIVPILVAAAIGFTLGAAYVLFGWVGAAVYLLPVLAVRESIRQYTQKVGAQLVEVRAAHAEADQANHLLSRLNRDLDETNAGLLKTLASVIDARDVYLYGHSVQAARYAREVALRLGLPPEEVKNAEYGALLHDIGKIGVSEAVLNKPARLTEEEYREVQTHCEIGYALLGNLPHFAPIADVVRSHHEEWDGSGYPRGLRGEEIPIAARIVSVVEATEAMVSDRPYRKGMTPDEVLEELARGAGSQWDPDVVEAFSGLLSQDRKHLAMRNSALDIALRRTPLSALLGEAAGVASVTDQSATFDTAEVPILILDDAMKVVTLNRRAEQVTGFQQEQLQGMPLAEICIAGDLPERLDGPPPATPHHLTLRRADEGGLLVAASVAPLRTSGAAYWTLLAVPLGTVTGESGGVPARVLLDPATGLMGLEGFRAHALAAMARAVRPLTVALLEVDGLAQIEETFGPEARAEALRTLGQTVSGQLRQADLAALWEEDRCAVLMPGSTPQDAMRLLARVATCLPGAYARLDFPVDAHHGIATWDGRERLDDLMARALSALQDSLTATEAVLPMRRHQAG